MSAAWKVFLWDIGAAAIAGLASGCLFCWVTDVPITFNALWPWALVFGVGCALLQLPWRFKKTDTDQ